MSESLYKPAQLLLELLVTGLTLFAWLLMWCVRKIDIFPTWWAHGRWVISPFLLLVISRGRVLHKGLCLFPPHFHTILPHCFLDCLYPFLQIAVSVCCKYVMAWKEGWIIIIKTGSQVRLVLATIVLTCISVWRWDYGVNNFSLQMVNYIRKLSIDWRKVIRLLRPEYYHLNFQVKPWWSMFATTLGPTANGFGHHAHIVCRTLGFCICLVTFTPHLSGW